MTNNTSRSPRHTLRVLGGAVACMLVVMLLVAAFLCGNFDFTEHTVVVDHVCGYPGAVKYLQTSTGKHYRLPRTVWGGDLYEEFASLHHGQRITLGVNGYGDVVGHFDFTRRQWIWRDWLYDALLSV